MMEEIFLYNKVSGEPLRALYSDTFGKALVINQSEPVQYINPNEGYVFIARGRENVEPRTIALMIGIIYNRQVSERIKGERAAALIRESSLHVTPTVLHLVVEIKKSDDPQLPWVLKIYDEKTREEFLYVPGYEDWHYAKTYASWYLVDLGNAQANIDFNYRIERENGK